MRKLVTWLLVTLGIAALVRKLRRREEEILPAAGTPSADPAAELRRKLDESRAEEAAPEPAQPAPGTASAPVADASVEDRRTEVHEQGRATLEEMQSQESEEP